MSPLSLILTLAFVLVTMLLSYRHHLKLEKDIFIGTIRTAVQLIAVGYLLHFIFSEGSWLGIGGMILVMITVATLNAAKKGKDMPGVKWRIALTISTAEGVAMLLMLGLHIIPPEPRYIIPISGMIIGNSMVVSGLYLNRMRAEAKARAEEMMVILALGGTSRKAYERTLQHSVKAAMMPSIDGMKTVGLVQLPGMMTGMIVAGANPIDAVLYQILIMYALAGSAAVTATILGLLSHSLLFNEHHQLKELSES
ncbi:MAG: iron export ABC transporter permease subunit FetB [Candidatus Carbobacillus sp.]|nr:iron export ABC transporter permease subunit FetB [Candidatus Carbobacillus sp.]